MTHLSPDDDPPVSGLAPFWRRRDLPDVAGDARRIGRCVTASACFVVAWSLVEVPWEIDISGSAGADGTAYASSGPMSSPEEIAAVLASKTLLFLIVGLALRRRLFARYVLLFVCLMSVLAMAPEIPVEYAHSRWLATLSAVECLGKLATFVFLALDLRTKR
ncbi:hypothetical protein AWB81_00626 [Caballeronia arationis]|jgi:hypothetical protein|uniref:Uncharacterized protein n=1 Tax=Caballeronia arationis TaxID=1777142 RepID=A0A7Z7N233_9BURK|nr:hypothetical protein [Caballeronia arationis]SAK47534.1 hypothetical protein AWB81_00626 [Caballeronia arationis]SOE59459.1 hypothetical protein SAMN05446927_1763 [Caballeronia arationis]